MADFELNGVTYRLATLDALTQFHVMRRVMPIAGAMEGGLNATARLFEAIGQMSDADAEYVIGKCLADCRRQNGEIWAKVYIEGRLMFEDIDMAGMLKLTMATLKEPLSDFFTGLGSISALAAT